jgi:hypothetical protein
MIKRIFCSILFQSFVYFGYCQKDTAIFNVRLIDTVTAHMIEYLPWHEALSIQFSTTDSNPKIFSVAFFEPDTYKKGFFQLNEPYNIYGHKTKEQYVFQSASTSSIIYVPLFICDSIFISK